MYNKILNPRTNRMININSKLGKSILQKYIYYKSGAAVNQPEDDTITVEQETILKKENRNIAKIVLDKENIVNDSTNELLEIMHKDGLKTAQIILGKVINGKLVTLYQGSDNLIHHRISRLIENMCLNAFNYIDINNLPFIFKIDFKSKKIRKLGIDSLPWHRDATLSKHDPKDPTKYTNKISEYLEKYKGDEHHMALIYYNDNPNKVPECITAITNLCTLNKDAILKPKLEETDCEKIIFNSKYGNADKSYIAYNNKELSHKPPETKFFDDSSISGIVRIVIRTLTGKHDKILVNALKWRQQTLKR